jgi:hypothetical protein
MADMICHKVYEFLMSILNVDIVQNRVNKIVTEKFNLQVLQAFRAQPYKILIEIAVYCMYVSYMVMCLFV